MRDRAAIVIVGGYGAVERVVCRKLAKSYPGRVIAARNIEKAEVFSAETGGRVLALGPETRHRRSFSRYQGPRRRRARYRLRRNR